MKHTFIGAGGVGGVLGTIFAHAGEDVTLVVRPGTAGTYTGESSLTSHFGNLRSRVKIAEVVSEVPDVLWITVKATQLQDALAGIPNSVSPKAIVPLLNGTDHVQVLRSRFGDDRVIPATIAGEMERVSPGNYVHPSPFLRLNVASAGSPLLDPAFEQLRRFGAECNYVEDEQTLLWTKMGFLAPIALSTSAANSTIGGVLSDPERRRKLHESIRETAHAARIHGAILDPEATINMIDNAPGQMRSSMQKDVAAGRQPELDAIAGPILRTAKAHGFPVAATQDLVDEIKRRILK